ncbi:hypothetical protein TrLO_g8845 [Triparma laevis f. longispina]|uniref:Uncharacterized protein n=1 Tax=Triparma laevis f. longispina TaxID=1714387 RepID=A0A9W7A8H7_9STRA|nr:hypothetical protein TrLO_g8845 [Triparma laevis f. longispina]
MHTPEFRRHFFGSVHVQTFMALRVATKGWNAAADALIDEGVASGAMIVHGGKGTSWAQEKRRKLVTRVIFLQNITNVGERACKLAINLVVVDIPEGVESIGDYAFLACCSLTTVSFPATLTLIGTSTFNECISLENVDLLHTNLQELGSDAFADCKNLTSMTILDSLQKLGQLVFCRCSKLAPSNINVNKTKAVISHLRSQQQ